MPWHLALFSRYLIVNRPVHGCCSQHFIQLIVDLRPRSTILFVAGCEVFSTTSFTISQIAGIKLTPLFLAKTIRYMEYEITIAES